jgi:hypothetical protein
MAAGRGAMDDIVYFIVGMEYVGFSPVVLLAGKKSQKCGDRRRNAS